MSNDRSGSQRPSSDDADDFDRRFSEIVAGLRVSEEETPDPDPAPTDGLPEDDSRRAATDQDDPDQDPPEEDRLVGAGVNPPVEPAAPAPADDRPPGWRDWEEPDGLPDHFVPEPPPPLPAGDLHFWGVVVGLVLGPLLLVLSNVVPVLRGDVWNWLGIGLCVGGFVLLVLRLPRQRDGDWGAQV